MPPASQSAAVVQFDIEAPPIGCSRLVGGRGLATPTHVIHDVTDAGAAAEPRLRAAAGENEKLI